MLHILFCILKLLGILLLILLVLVLAVSGLVLFVPVRYRADIRQEEERTLEARIHWLLHAFGVHIRSGSGGLLVRVRLFWIVSLQLCPKKEKPQKVKKKKQQRAKKKKRRAEQPRPGKPREAKPPGSGKPEEPEEPKSGMRTELEEPKSGMRTGPEEPGIRTQKEPKPEAAESRKPGRPSLFRKIRAGFRRLLQFFRNLKYTFREICDKISHGKERLDAYRELLGRDETRKAFRLCREKLFRMLAHIAPQKVTGTVRMGTGDPALTGQIYGGYCAVSGMQGYRVRVTPDFEEQVLKGWLRIQGRIRMAALLLCVLQTVFDRNVKMLIKELRGLSRRAGQREQV